MSFIDKFSRRKKKPDLIQDIMRNLENILNTKKDYGSFFQTLGIGDYNQYQARDKIIATIIREITENLEKYEPRVKLLSIKEPSITDSFRIRFELRCVILDNPQPIFIVFDSMSQDFGVEGL